MELLAHRVYIKPIRHSDIRAVSRCCTITETISMNERMGHWKYSHGKYVYIVRSHFLSCIICRSVAAWSRNRIIEDHNNVCPFFWYTECDPLFVPEWKAVNIRLFAQGLAGHWNRFWAWYCNFETQAVYSVCWTLLLLLLILPWLWGTWQILAWWQSATCFIHLTHASWLFIFGKVKITLRGTRFCHIEGIR
jgi:hypothetical protein